MITSPVTGALATPSELKMGHNPQRSPKSELPWRIQRLMPPEKFLANTLDDSNKFPGISRVISPQTLGVANNQPVKMTIRNRIR